MSPGWSRRGYTQNGTERIKYLEGSEIRGGLSDGSDVGCGAAWRRWSHLAGSVSHARIGAVRLASPPHARGSWRF